jgi:hypothetical protein
MHVKYCKEAKCINKIKQLYNFINNILALSFITCHKTKWSRQKILILKLCLKSFTYRITPIKRVQI